MMLVKLPRPDFQLPVTQARLGTERFVRLAAVALCIAGCSDAHQVTSAEPAEVVVGQPIPLPEDGVLVMFDDYAVRRIHNTSTSATYEFENDGNHKVDGRVTVSIEANIEDAMLARRPEFPPDDRPEEAADNHAELVPRRADIAEVTATGPKGLGRIHTTFDPPVTREVATSMINSLAMIPAADATAIGDKHGRDRLMKYPQEARDSMTRVVPVVLGGLEFDRILTPAGSGMFTASMKRNGFKELAGSSWQVGLHIGAGELAEAVETDKEVCLLFFKEGGFGFGGAGIRTAVMEDPAMRGVWHKVCADDMSKTFTTSQNGQFVSRTRIDQLIEALRD